MIKLIDMHHDNIVAFRVSGVISKRDVKLVLNAMRQAINTNGSVSLLEIIDSFCGFRLGVIPAKIKYLFDMGLTGIDKIAVVTDKRWLRKAVKLENYVFRTFDMKPFPKNELMQALYYLDPNLDEASVNLALAS